MIRRFQDQCNQFFRTQNRIASLLAGLVYCSCIFFHQSGFRSAIPVSRLDVLHSIVEDGVINIDRFQENTPDKAFFSDHYYSDKAPATIFLALPFFSVSSILLSRMNIDLDSSEGWLFTSWISCACTQAVLVATGTGALFLWLCKRVDCSSAFLASAGIALGGMPMAYSSLLMSHSATFGLLAWSIYLGDEALCKISEWGRGVLIGCCLGLTVAGEYSSGIAVLTILFSLPKKNGALFAGILFGFLPGILLILAYNMACFGNPVSFGYHHQAVFIQMHDGFFGIRWPSLANMCYLSFGVRQGLFVWSPVLVMAFVGFSIAEGRLRKCITIFYVATLLNLVVLSGYFLPEAGMMIGARLLSPILVLLALPVAIGINRFKLLGCSLTLFSIITTVFLVSVDIRLPNMEVPELLMKVWNDLLAGRTSFNLAMLLGFRPVVGTAMIVIVTIAVIQFVHQTLCKRPFGGVGST